MARGDRLGVIVGCTLVVLSCTTPASAERKGDGLYGRWDRGWVLFLGVGSGSTWRGDRADANVVANVGLLIADTAGLTLASRWGRKSGQYLFCGIVLHPLLPALFFLNKQTSSEFADLVLQSLFFEIGPAFLLDGNKSVGLGVGFGLELPLYRPLRTVRGLWLRIAARHVNTDPSHRNTQPTAPSTQWTLYAALVLRIGFKSTLSRWEPRRFR